MTPRHFAPLAALLATAACTTAKPPVLTASDPRNEGIAASCTPTNPDFSKPGPYNASIAMTNDGWCGVFAVARNGKPFRLGLVPVATRPAHGRVLIQPVENATRIEYTPDSGFTGTDTFKATLRTATDEEFPLTVSVNVTGGARSPVAAPTTTSNRPAAAAAPARRSTRRTTGTTAR